MEAEEINNETALTAMFQSIIESKKEVFYKSLQVTDQELNDGEKLEILTNIFNQSRSTFLSRYGKYLKKEHLILFETQEDQADYYEIQHYLNEIVFRLANHENLVKNRRFNALQKMIETSEYFSEVEMMRREPVLYHQLVGQYLTEDEVRERDFEECPGDSLVNILLQGIDNRDGRAKINENSDENEEDSEKVVKSKRKIDTEIEEFDTDDEDQMMDDELDNSESFSKSQWGNFDSAETQSGSKTSQDKTKFILAPEKHLLQDEFKGIMYANFLSGKDKDFNYDTIDEDSQYDDEILTSRDMEDKYFDSEEPEKEENCHEIKEDQSEEDDLDIYMKALEKQIHRRDVDDMSTQLEFLKRD
uniref:CSON014940 protein n=1 Tax=Culicoides sonorensis TaxID=179676 RepID=A0A336KTA6_CULSO